MVSKAYHIQESLTVNYDLSKLITGLKFLGTEIIKIASVSEIDRDEPLDYSIIGSVGTISDWHYHMDIEVPLFDDYPEVFKDYYGRRIRFTNLDSVCSMGTPPYFVKPASKGRFTPISCFGEKDHTDFIWDTMHLHPMTPVILQDCVKFVAEWRVFVLNRKIIDVRQYHGDWDCQPDVGFITKLPVGDCPYPTYCVDVGKISDGTMCVVECNRADAFGSYGLMPTPYAEMYLSWWNNLLPKLEAEKDNNER